MSQNNDKILKAEYVQQVIGALNIRIQTLTMGIQMFRESIDELKLMIEQFLGKERFDEMVRIASG